MRMMRQIIGRLAIVAAATSFGVGYFSVAEAVGISPSKVIVFGDSLSDIGNIDDATFGVVPGSSYFSGRFSNGPAWVERLAERPGRGPAHAEHGRREQLRLRRRPDVGRQWNWRRVHSRRRRAAFAVLRFARGRSERAVRGVGRRQRSVRRSDRRERADQSHRGVSRIAHGRGGAAVSRAELAAVGQDPRVQPRRGGLGRVRSALEPVQRGVRSERSSNWRRRI